MVLNPRVNRSMDIVNETSECHDLLVDYWSFGDISTHTLNITQRKVTLEGLLRREGVPS